MTRTHPIEDVRTEIDDRLASIFDAGGGDVLRATAPDPSDREDRWYGRFLVVASGTVADESDPEAALAGATAIELLREYYRLRSELLGRGTDGVAHSPNRAPTDALLTGDYVFASAFATLDDVGRREHGEWFDALTTTSRRVIEALWRAHRHERLPPEAVLAYVDETAGALGEAAGSLAASVATAERADRQRLATLGRGLGIVRRTDRLLDADARAGLIARPALEAGQLETDPLVAHRDRHLAAAADAIESLPVARDRDVFDRLSQ